MLLRLVSIVLVALVFSSAAAVDLPDYARLTLVSEDGVVLGVGQIADGDLTLTLQGGADGLVKLLIVADDGTILALDAMVTDSGSVMITQENSFEDLAMAVRAAGGAALVSYEEPIAPDLGNDTAVDTPGGNNAGGVGAAPGGNNGAAGAESPGDGPNENAGDNPNENAGNGAEQGPNENAGDNPNAGPNENAGDNPDEGAGNNPNMGPNENAGDDPDQGPDENAGDDPDQGPNENAGDNPNQGPNENAGDNPNENAGGPNQP